jgi:hypothetical protein
MIQFLFVRAPLILRVMEKSLFELNVERKKERKSEKRVLQRISEKMYITPDGRELK